MSKLRKSACSNVSLNYFIKKKIAPINIFGQFLNESWD